MIWIRGLLQELGFNSQGPMRLYCDIRTTISIVHDLVQDDGTKHVKVDIDFIKEKLQTK